MERTTKTIITPKTNKEVVIYDYITGGEALNLQEIIFACAKISPDPSKESGVSMSDISPDFLKKRQDFILKSLVHSFDSSSDNLLTRLRELPSPDYNFVMQELEAIADMSETSTSEKKSS